MGDEGGNEDGRAAVEVLARAGATADQGRSLSELGFSLLASEGPAFAIDVLEEGLDICVRTGVVSAEGNLRENLGEALFDAGRWDEALDQIAWQFRAAEQLGFDRVLLVAEMDLLAIELAKGNEVSIASPADALERAARFQGPAVANVVDRIAGALLSRGELEEARATLAGTIDGFAAAPLAVRTIHLPACLRLCRELDEPQLAEGFVRGLVPPSAPRMRAAVITAGATANEISQAFDDARDGYATAIPLWDAGGCVVEAAQARAGLGRALWALGRTEDATTPLMQARTRFAELGAARWVADVDRWLEGDTALTS